MPIQAFGAGKSCFWHPQAGLEVVSTGNRACTWEKLSKARFLAGTIEGELSI